MVKKLKYFLFVFALFGKLNAFGQNTDNPTKATFKASDCNCHILLTDEKDTDECAPQYNNPPDLPVPGIKLSCCCPKTDTIISFELVDTINGLAHIYKSTGWRFTNEMLYVVRNSKEGSMVIIQNVLVSGKDEKVTKLSGKIIQIK